MTINKDKLDEFILTLLHSWGGDTPSEAMWAFNEFIDWAEEKFDIKISSRYDSSEDWETNENLVNEVILAINNSK